MTLRQAAVRTARSLTTLRRYVRSGRLLAEKLPGRFGPEYFVSHAALHAAGLAPAGPEPAAAGPAERAVAVASAVPAPPRPAPRPSETVVPASLFGELQMKHEQLLVQYGMVRAAGLRLLELRAELEAQRRRGAEREREIARLREAAARRTAELEKELRRAHLELEGRTIEIAALREKLRTLEMLSRNARTSDGIERRFVEGVRRAPASRDGGPVEVQGADDH